MCTRELINQTLEKKDEGIEIIMRFHSTMTDISTQLYCFHYNSVTLAPIKCDCTRLLKCNCIRTSVCEMCWNTQMSHTPHTFSPDYENCMTCQRLFDSTPPCDHTTNPQYLMITHRKCRLERDCKEDPDNSMLHIAMSKRAFNLVMINKAEIKQPLVHIIRTRGTKNERNCYHHIFACDVYVKCECIRSPEGDFILSKEYLKGIDYVILDESSSSQKVKSFPITIVKE